MKLYKYTTISNNSISMLLDQYVWFSKPAALNDPFDCGLVENEFIYEKTIGRRGILSLSATVRNTIMWAHYADSHKGLCIEFDEFSDSEIASEPLRSHLNPSNAPTDRLTIIQNAHPIEYLTDDEIAQKMIGYPAENLEMLAAYKAAESTGKGDDFTKALSDTVYIKHKDWAYEQEYRLAIEKGDQGVALPGKITALYLGMKAGPQQCRIVANIRAKMTPAPDLFKMQKVPGTVSLEARGLTQADYYVPGVKVV
jgi:hypothetical protein